MVKARLRAARLGRNASGERGQEPAGKCAVRERGLGPCKRTSMDASGDTALPPKPAAWEPSSHERSRSGVAACCVAKAAEEEDGAERAASWPDRGAASE